MVGIGTMSKEGSAEVNYLFREAPGTAPPVRRGTWVGEVGWMIPQFKDWRSFTSGHQMTVSVDQNYFIMIYMYTILEYFFL